MTTDTTAEHDVIAPEDAASRIAERLKARDSWIVTIPPAVFPAALRRLGKLFGAVIYTDHGIDSVITVTTPSDANQLADFVEAAVALSAITGADYTATAVAVIPKTVPRGMFQRALGQKLPAGTDQDVILLQGPSGKPFRYVWPGLFLDACDLYEPGSTAKIRAQGTPTYCWPNQIWNAKGDAS